MATGPAPKRSIDEIIGSIRSIVDRGGSPERSEETRFGAANDDLVPDDLGDLTDLPPPREMRRAETRPAADIYAEPERSMHDAGASSLAEPVATPRAALLDDDQDFDLAEIEQAASDAVADFSPEVIDTQRMAEIAAAVERNLKEIGLSSAALSRIEAQSPAEVANDPQDTPAAPAPEPAGARRGGPRPAAAFGTRRNEDLDREFAAYARGEATVPEASLERRVAASFTPDSLEEGRRIEQPADAAAVAADAARESEDSSAASPYATLDRVAQQPEPTRTADPLQGFIADDDGTEASPKVAAGPDEQEDLLARHEDGSNDAMDDAPVHNRIAALREAVSAPRPPVVVPKPVPDAAALAVAETQASSARAAEFVIDEDMLRPVVREWMDDNLPPIVERLVREELMRAIEGNGPRRN